MSKSTWRESRVFVPANTVKEHLFVDTKPNYVVLANNSGANLYMALSPVVSSTTFDMIVPAYGRKIYARDQGFEKIYLYTEAPDGAWVHVTSFVADFSPAHISQTQEIVGTSATGLLGVIDVNQIMSPLPAGTNKIGSVDINGFNASLPSGANLIGKVDVNSLPSLPTGGNLIGKVDINSIAANAKVGLDINQEITVLPSAARTATTSMTIVNTSCKGGKFIINVTAVTGAPSITVKIQGVDPVSGATFDILVSSAITAVSTTVLTVYPGISSTPNIAVSDVLPKTVKVTVEHANTDSITYSVAACLVA